MRKFLSIFLVVAMLAALAITPAMAATVSTPVNLLPGNTLDMVVTPDATTPDFASGDIIFFTSSNESVAKVVPAAVATATDATSTITAVKDGVAVITAKTAAGVVLGTSTIVVKPFGVKKVVANTWESTNVGASVDFTRGATNAITFDANVKDATDIDPTTVAWKINGSSVTGNGVIGGFNYSVDATNKTLTLYATNAAQDTDLILVEVTADNSAAATAKTASAKFVAKIAGAGSRVDLNSFIIEEPNSRIIATTGSISLKTKLNPTNANESIVWNSSANDIATVTGNHTGAIVTGVKSGNVIITATSASGKVATIALTVLDKVAPTHVAIDKSVVRIARQKGELELEATVTPLNAVQDVTWKFASAAFVDGSAVYVSPTEIREGTASGRLVAKLNGNVLETANAAATDKLLDFAVVVATTREVGIDGKQLTDNIMITTSDYIPANVINLSTPASDKIVIDREVKLTAAVKDIYGRTATQSDVIWTTSNSDVATVKDGVVKGLKTGTVTITAYAKYAAPIAPATTVSKSVTFYVVKEVSSSLKTVNATTLKVRALASTAAGELGSLKRGDVVEVLETAGAWTKISFSGTYAYVATAALADLSNVAVVSGTLNVRDGVGTDGKVIGTLKFGETVQVVGKVDNTNWLEIIYKNGKAYIYGTYVANAPLAGVVTSGTLTLRASASSTAPAYATKLVKGQAVELIGKEGAFYQVKLADGSTGFAAAQYISLF